MTRKKTIPSDLIPDVTVITPTFNRASLVTGAIKSVLRQTHKNFEYFIVDDGSIDGTDKVIHPYLSDPRVFYFKKENGGQASALNLGVSFAQSKWIAFLDSDDEFYPSHLKQLLSHVTKDPTLDFVVGSFETIGIDPNDAHVVDYFNPEKTIPLNQVEIACGTLLIKKKSLVKYGGFQGILSDVALIDRMKKGHCRWKKSHRKTLKYYYGRTKDSISLNQIDLYNRQAKASSNRS